MNLQVTTWGSIQPVYVHSGKILSEIVTFHANGSSHKHKDDWEICTVIKGEGKIITSRDGITQTNKVNKGSVVKIPPGTPHWMEVEPGGSMVIMIAYVKHE